MVTEHDARKAGAAEMEAAAARAAAMSEPSTTIKKPLDVDLYDYTHIAIVDATFANPVTGAQGASRGSYKATAESLSNSPLSIVNPLTYDKKKFKKNKRFLREIKNPKWLYFYFVKSIQGVDDVRSVVVRNFQNRLIYSVVTVNVSFDETISPLVNF